ncbi:hypothetical protein BC831DRAFT_468451 [Entophlyctis helioformis]|nr:hypothetical protein BC831DRAFT_468451 [Entophlyctis helioformis]
MVASTAVVAAVQAVQLVPMARLLLLLPRPAVLVVLAVTMAASTAVVVAVQAVQLVPMARPRPRQAPLAATAKAMRSRQPPRLQAAARDQTAASVSAARPWVRTARTHASLRRPRIPITLPTPLGARRARLRLLCRLSWRSLRLVEQVSYICPDAFCLNE